MILKFVSGSFVVGAAALGVGSIACGFLNPLTATAIAFLALASIAIFPWRGSP